MIRVRGDTGKFVQKSDEPRQVRSLRLTDSTWAALGESANQRGITRADLIEEMTTNQTDVIHDVISVDDAKNLAIKLLKAKTTKVETIVKLISTIYNVELSKSDLET